MLSGAQPLEMRNLTEVRSQPWGELVCTTLSVPNVQANPGGF